MGEHQLQLSLSISCCASPACRIHRMGEHHVHQLQLPSATIPVGVHQDLQRLVFPSKTITISWCASRASAASCKSAEHQLQLPSATMTMVHSMTFSAVWESIMSISCDGPYPLLSVSVRAGWASIMSISCNCLQRLLPRGVHHDVQRPFSPPNGRAS